MCALINAFLAPLAHAADAAQAARAGRAPNKVTHVEPVYPPDAPRRVRGAVTLEITVASDGRAVDARVLRSSPPFDQPAVDAVRQWRYDMTGIAAPFVTTVSVIFTPPRTTATVRTPSAANPQGSVASAASLDVYAGGVTPPQQVRAEIRSLTASIESGALGKDAARSAYCSGAFFTRRVARSDSLAATSMSSWPTTPTTTRRISRAGWPRFPRISRKRRSPSRP